MVVYISWSFCFACGRMAHLALSQSCGSHRKFLKTRRQALDWPWQILFTARIPGGLLTTLSRLPFPLLEMDSLPTSDSRVAPFVLLLVQAGIQTLYLSLSYTASSAELLKVRYVDRQRGLNVTVR